MSLMYFIVFLSLIVAAAHGEEHLHTNGPFGKVHLNAEKPSPHHCDKSIDVSSPFAVLTSIMITELKVSSTTYSNTDAIYVSWTPSSTPCKDDFIGVYFVEVPIETGKT